MKKFVLLGIGGSIYDGLHLRTEILNELVARADEKIDAFPQGYIPTRDNEQLYVQRDLWRGELAALRALGEP